MQISGKKITDLTTYPIWIKQATKFLLVGVLNTAVDLVIYFILTHWVGYFSEQKVLAKGISYSFGILNSFFWNKTWTFKSQSSNLKTLAPFVLTNLVGLVVNTYSMEGCLNQLHMPEFIALGVATASTLLWNFLISKFVVFRK